MIKNPQLLTDFETTLMRSTPADHRRSLQIADALYAEACSLAIFPLKNPLDGLEVDLRLARVINSVRGTSKKDRAISG